MESYRVAHIQDEGVDVILVPVPDSFRQRTVADQKRFIEALQGCAKSTGMSGTVVPIYETESDTLGFVASKELHTFLKKIDLNFVESKLNGDLSCHY